ncbi:MAG: hypothetical protein JXB19_07755 [Bacteroidales bacterium]|nr:hypothetical protein [Bacteroidales bacterium]
MKYILYILILMPVCVFVSCEDNLNRNDGGDYGPGIYIVHEGFYGNNNGSVSYYNPFDGTLVHNIFNDANGRPLGDVVQSFAVNGDTTGFIVVNNSAKVEIVNLSDFKTAAQPIIVTYPRYFLPVTAEKGYLTSGSMQGYVLIVDLKDMSVIDSITVGSGPESLIALNGKAYICNSGGWGLDSTVSVIDVSTDHVVQTIEVSDGPVDMAVDADGNLWIYCKGYALYNWDPPYELIRETDAYLHKIDPVTGVVLWRETVGKAGDFSMTPPKCAISDDGLTLFYLRPDGVYSLSVRNPGLVEEPVLAGSGFYGIEVNPGNGEIYLFEANLSGNGLMKIYDAEMHPVAFHTVGIMPSGAVFVP